VKSLSFSRVCAVLLLIALAGCGNDSPGNGNNGSDTGGGGSDAGRDTGGITDTGGGGGDMGGGGDTGLLDCQPNEYLLNAECLRCEPGTTSPGGDAASCDATICGADEFVENNACTPCAAGSSNPAGDDASGENTSCTATLCAADQYVSSNACVPCAEGESNMAGDDATGADTMCDGADLCASNQYVSGNTCTNCPAGTTNDAGDDAAGGDTQCDAVICGSNQRVAGNTCGACPAGTTNAAGDDASGADTSCDATICAIDQRVVANACVACAPGRLNDAGDDASGADTTCDPVICFADERVDANACVMCPPGTTNAAGDDASGVNTTCDAVLCGADESVTSNTCVPCGAGLTNLAGDDASGADTTCDGALCASNQRVQANACVPCGPGTSNAAGDDSSGADTTCDAILCGLDQRVAANVCVACAAGTENAAGDDASGADTTCTAVICAADEFVQFNACVACPAASTNVAGDDASGPDTMCDSATCLKDFYVSSNACVACAPGTTNDPGDLASGADTSCDDVICITNGYVANHVCTTCPAGTTNTGGDNAAGPDTDCDPTICGVGEKVINNACVACQPGSTNTDGGDNAALGDTDCDHTICGLHEFVDAAHTCQPCATPGYQNTSANDATGAPTVCDDDINECAPGAMAPYDDNCDVNATCTNTVGSFTCACNTSLGYAGSGTSCAPIICTINQRVSNHACVACANGYQNTTGNRDATGNNSTCADNINECALVSTQGNTPPDNCDDTAIVAPDSGPGPKATCTDITTGGANSFSCACDTTKGWEGATGIDGNCTATICTPETSSGLNTYSYRGQRVNTNHACELCPVGQHNASSDNATGSQTTCDDVICDNTQRVQNNVCVPCAAGYWNTTKDNATGPNTACEDINECNGATGTPIDGAPTAGVNNCDVTPPTSSTCTNTAGSFSCACRADQGYMGNGLTCTSVVCGLNQYVDGSHQCQNCASGEFRAAGDLATGVATTCAPATCGTDEHVVNYACAACPAGYGNASGDLTNAAGGNTPCDLCAADFRSTGGGNCTACLAGDFNAYGDSNAAATTCDYTQCAQDEYVDGTNLTCATCTVPGLSNTAGDYAHDGGSYCDACDADYYVSGATCVACPGTSTNAFGDNVNGGNTSCDFPRSCQELNPATSGSYTIYPAGTVGSAITVECDMTTSGGGWTILRRSDFSSDAGYNCSVGACSTTTCGAYGTILGGYNVFGAGASVQLNQSTLGIPHAESYVSFDFIKIDSWDNEQAQFRHENGILWFQNYAVGSGTAQCGNGGGWNDASTNVVRVSSQTDTFVNLDWRATINQAANDESWGLDNVLVMIR
jgi:hypothetical protein